ncbi:hypothetical protein FN846DRAFT_931252 [Sphaerosporella brunnea]|uniref:Uncharacterized protein n=1 Tax=Sphaerosporella brunnea TaxID=1250544 RepID=A0A5J5F7M8_9PEZI|nr:hypothetical protein FN846DRAFT_931252 [Sphaerosporella brunnea]
MRHSGTLAITSATLWTREWPSYSSKLGVMDTFWKAAYSSSFGAIVDVVDGLGDATLSDMPNGRRRRVMLKGCVKAVWVKVVGRLLGVEYPEGLLVKTLHAYICEKSALFFLRKTFSSLSLVYFRRSSFLVWWLWESSSLSTSRSYHPTHAQPSPPPPFGLSIFIARDCSSLLPAALVVPHCQRCAVE